MTSEPPPLQTSRRGRPAAFTGEKRKHFCSLIRLGCRRGLAAEMIGLDRHTVRRALRRDPDFAAQIRELEAEAAFRFMRQVNQASATQWRAAAWIIEQSEKPHPRAVTVRKLVRSREFNAAVARCPEIIALKNELASLKQAQARDRASQPAKLFPHGA
jgi:hypothetical protein